MSSSDVAHLCSYSLLALDLGLVLCKEVVEGEAYMGTSGWDRTDCTSVASRCDGSGFHRAGRAVLVCLLAGLFLFGSKRGSQGDMLTHKIVVIQGSWQN